MLKARGVQTSAHPGLPLTLLTGGLPRFVPDSDPGGVGADVAAELAHRFQQLPLPWTNFLDVQVYLQVLDHQEGAEDVAVPEEPLQPLQLPRHLGRQRRGRAPCTEPWPSGP